MAENEIDPAVMEKTRKELGAIIKAPKLSDKLLKKPPFRFLHDIVTNVIKATGFATKLYTADEMDSSKVQEKDAKIHFLQKIISSVNYTLKLQPPLAAKPIKIVSGFEPHHTNEFLQKLAAATKVPIEKSDKAISKVLARFADKIEQAQKERRESTASGAPSDAKAKEAPAPAPAAAPAKEEAKPDDAAPAKAEGGGGAAAAVERKDSGAALAEAKAKAEAAAAALAAVEQKEKDAQQAEALKAEAEAKAKAQPTPIERREERAKNKDVKEKDVQGPTGIMVEGEKGDKGTLDTDSEEEVDPAEVAAMQAAQAEASGMPPGESDGYLIQMAQAKKADEEQKQRAAKEQAERLGTEGEAGGIMLKTTRNRGGRDREVFTTEVSKLKDSLQSLVKITNPLGKTFDYLQEDLDSMTKEKALWHRQAQDTKVQAQEAEHATEESLQPIYSQIQDLEDAISDQLNKIHTTRANILKNDQVIETLLRMVAN